MTEVEALGRRSRPSKRIAIHDYCGHPFQFQLSRELARRGYEVRHFYFAEDAGPKGNTHCSAQDPAGFSVEPISLNRPYSKTNLIQRRQADVLYGKLASQKIARFKPDVTISGNTPLEAQAPILRRSHSVGSAFIFWMQDFYSLAAARILSQKLPIVGHAIGAYYRYLEATMLRQSDGVVLVSNDFKQQLRQLGVKEGVTEVIPNWGALDELPVQPKDTAWARERRFADKFVFLYSGTLALKHNPDLLWALAEHFENDPEVLIAVAGAGVSYEALKRRCASEPRSNLTLLPLQPMEVFPDMLGSADVLVALLENDAGPFSVPSKVLNYLCAGRPVLLSAPSDNLSTRVVEAAGAGVCVPAGDKEAFVAAAERLRNEHRTRTDMGASARAYAEGTFDIAAITDRFEKMLAHVCPAITGYEPRRASSKSQRIGRGAPIDSGRGAGRQAIT